MTQSWIIGDIHGCLWELAGLLRKLPAEANLIFLGDYIDRGPDSAGCIDLLLAEKERSVFLRGNHEEMLLDYFRSGGKDNGRVWLNPANGGLQTLQSYGLDSNAKFDEIPLDHRSFYENLKLWHEAEDFIAVHAGLNINKPKMENQKVDDLLWIRSRWITNEAQWTGKKVYFGHTPSRNILGKNRENEPIRGKKSTGIDTGCVYGGSLTAINPQTSEIIQIGARKRYW